MVSIPTTTEVLFRQYTVHYKFMTCLEVVYCTRELIRMTSHSAMALLHYHLLILLTVCLLLGDGGTTSSMATRRTWTTKEGCMEVERDALLVFKAGVEDPADRLSSWRDQVDCCRWSHVVCDNRTGHAHVVKLNLQTDDVYWDEPDARIALRGKILSSSLLSLTQLRSLNLSGNDFEWKQIPKIIGSFTRLKYLDLSWSNFGGTIPPQIGNLSTLRHLDLNSYSLNSMTDYLLTRADNLETWLPRLSSLRYLSMRGVNLSTSSNSWVQAINMIPSLEELHLRICGLTNIPFSLSYTINLTALTTLDLHWNYFNSTLPSWLWKLGTLSYLELGYSEFYGKIPPEIGNLTSLTTLILTDNELGGDTLSMSRSIGNLFSLRALDFSRNNLRAYGIPKWLMRMNNLTYLDLSLNILTGPLPADIGKLSNLRYLDLSSNLLEGNVSEYHFANMTKLEDLYLSNNSLSFHMGDHPPFQLKRVGMSSCNLGPRFPRWLRWQRSIVELDLSNTSIEGPLPSWLWNSWPSLAALDLSYNKLNGTLPISLEGMKDLIIFKASTNQIQGQLPAFPNSIEMLDMSSNSLSGPLPPTLPTQNLTFLFLSNNHISGTMPSNFCDMIYLLFLDLSNNYISGKIPSCRQPLDYLLYVNLANNHLSGRIPTSITGSKLEYMNLNNNSLFGELPPSLQNCSGLTTLNLGENKLSGSIPTWIGERLQELAILRLRLNSFSGNIPPQLGQLADLHIMDLADNKLSGSIPHSFGNFSEMISTLKHDSPPFAYGIISFPKFVVYPNENIIVSAKGQRLGYSSILDLVKSIDLSNNNLKGKIPEELGELVALQTLNLSGNNLQGKIPDSIGKLESVETLDLSFNNLSGIIPQGLSTLTKLSHFNVSYNNLSGSIPSGNQLQTLDDPYIYIGNAYLCGPPILKNCSFVVLEDEEAKEGSETKWLFLSVILGFIVGLWSVFVFLLYGGAWRYYYFEMMDNIYDKLYVFVAIKIRRN